jgi:hypothetical protein
MTAAEAEAVIRRTLDGHFFTMTFAREGVSEPRVKHQKVPPDFLPEYHLMADETEAAQEHSKKAAPKHRPWTDEEVKQLIAMRQAGTRWDFIAREIRRCNRSIKERYAELAEELNLPPPVNKSGRFSTLTDEQRVEILRRRGAGESFSAIEQAMGIRAYQARDYYNRHIKAIKERRRAA